MSAQEEQSTAASEPKVAEHFGGTSMEDSRDVMEEGLKAKLKKDSTSRQPVLLKVLKVWTSCSKRHQLNRT